MHSKFSWHAAAGVGALIVTGPGWAQTATSNSDQFKLEEIVITAEHRSADAQRTPIALTILSGEALEQAGIVDAKSMLTAVPGFSISQSSQNTNLGLRGLSAGGGNQYADPAVAFNINGVTLGRPFSAAASFYDLERVEVLKGPQGTLYGRNATVGAVNLIPKRPGFDFEGAAGLAAGNYGHLETSGAVNVPLIDERLAMRLAFKTTKHDGYLSNGLNDADNQAARLGMNYVATDELSVYFSADYFRDKSRGAGTIYQYLNGFNASRFSNPNDPWETLSTPPCAVATQCPTWGNGTQPTAPAIAAMPVIGADAHTNNTATLLMSQIDWSNALGTLTIIPAFVQTRTDFINYGQGFRQVQKFDIDQSSLETRLASTGEGRLTWLLGGYVFREEQNGQGEFLNGRGNTVLAANPLLDKNYAFFGQTTFSILDRLRLTTGLRYTSENKSQSGYAIAAAADNDLSTPACSAASLAAGAIEVPPNSLEPVGGCQFPNTGDVTFTDTSYRVGIEMDLAADSLLYGNVSTAFKSGGLTIGLAPNSYQPEKLTSYQLGSKNRFFEGRLQANIEIFYWDYDDQQVSLIRPLNPPQLTQSAPVNVPGWVKGAELEVVWLATRHDRIGLNLLYEKGEYKLFPTTVSNAGVVGGVANAPRAFLPEYSGTLNYQHTFEFGFGDFIFGAQSHYESKSWLSVNRSVGTDRPAYHVSDADLTYQTPSENWSVTAFVKNIEDEPVLFPGTSGSIGPGILYRPTSNPTAPYASIGAPRTYGLRVTAKF